jgi:uncharacterized protein YjdB
MKKFYQVLELFVFLSISLFIGDANAQTTYYSKALATDFNDVASWGTSPDGSGTAPGSISNADIFVVGNGANLTLSAATSVYALYIGGDSSYTSATSVGALNVSSGDTLIVSHPTGNNATLSIGNSGTLNVTGGYLLLNGNFRQTAGIFNQQGGLIAVDGNSGVDSTSVAASISIFDVSNGALNLSGGTLMLVDPPSASNATSAIYIAVAGNATGNHTLQLGDGVSTDSSASSSGMVLNVFPYKFRNLTVNNNVSASNNRSASLTSNLSLGADLTILPGAEIRSQSNLNLKLAGNLTNNGKLIIGVNDTLLFEGNTAQTISGSGNFSNNTVNPTANFGGIAIANRSSAGVTFSGTGWHSLPSTASNALSFYSGDSTMLNRVNIGNDTFTLGTNLNPGGLMYYYQGGFTGGTFRRYMPAAAVSDGSTAGRFPFVSAASASKNLSRVFSIGVNSLNKTGTFSVSFLDSAGSNPVTPFKDNNSIIEKVSKSSWKVSHLFDAGSSGSNLTLRIDGAGMISSPVYQGVRITGATGSILTVGQGDIGSFGGISNPQGYKSALKVSDLSATPVSLYLGMDSVVQTAQSGPWQSGSTWVGGVVPGPCRVVAISNGHSITVNSGSSSALDLYILYGGSLTIAGGNLVVGCDTLRNHQIRNNGVLQVNSGTLTVNGSLLNLSGNTFTQTGGSIVIDPSDHGNPTSSTSSGSALYLEGGCTYSLSGGSITIVDPPLGNAVTSNTSAFPASGNHVFIFGNGVSADTNANSNGFIIWGGSSSMSMQNVIVNGPFKNARTVSFSNAFGILGNLTINSGGRLKLAPGPGLSVGGNVTVNAGGTLDGLGANTLSMQRYIGGVASPSGVSQSIGGAGNFFDKANSPTGNLYSLKINCGNANTVTINPMNTVGPNPIGASVSSALNLQSGKLLISSGTLIKGTQAGGAGPAVVQTPGSGIAPCAYSIWYSASETGSSINAGVDPTSTFKYPFVTSDSLDRSFYIERNSPTGAGLIGVRYYDDPNKKVLDTILLDGSYVLNRHTGSSWFIYFYAGNPSASSFELAAVSQNNYVSVNGANNRLISFMGGVGTHQSGTGTPCAQRSGLSLSDLQRGPFHIATDSSNILGAPFISRQPGYDTACFGTNASFSVVAINAAIYQWQKNTATGWVNLSNGTVYSGVDTSTMSIAAADTSMEGSQFRCIMRNAADSTISSAASLHVIFAPMPTITAATEPNPSQCLGHSQTFIATVTNAGTNPFFQWKINGADMGINDDSLVALTPKNLDTVIALVVSNAVCARPDTISSVPIVLHLLPMVNPVVTIDTPAGPICRGSMVVFTATSTDGGAAPNYRWIVNGNQVGTGDTLRSTAFNNHDTISCIIASNAACLISALDTSNTVVIKVDSIPARPSVINGPDSVCSGATNIYSVQPDSAATSYSWTLPYGWTGHSDSASITAIPAATGGTISVTADNACGSSAPETLTVTANATVTPTVSISAVGGNSICAGTPVTFNATVTDSGAVPTYTWRLNGSLVGTGLSYSNSSLNQGDSITLSMTSSLVCTTQQTVSSAAIYMTVNPLPVVMPISGNSAVCAGDSTALGSVTTSGIWTSNDPTIASVSSTGYVTGIAAGTDTIRYTVTNASGCSTSVIHLITVNTLPVVAAITGPNNVCESATATLSNTTSGGVWSSSDNSIATVDGTGLLTGIAAGTDTIRYTVTNASGCSTTVIHLITVNALPVVATITGNNSVCENATATLSNATAGGVWSSSDNSIATVSNTGLVTGVAAGTDTIRYTVTNASGCSTTVIHLITANALPAVATITGSNTVCENATATLSNTTSGGVWSSSDNSIATVDGTGLLTGLSAGTDTIRYTVTNASGCSTTVIHLITVNALPVVATITGSNSVCENANTTLSNSTSGGVWSSSDNSIATVSSTGQVTGVAAGTDTITYTVTTSSGCSSSVSTVITVKPLPATPSAITGATSVCSGTSQTYRVSIDTNISSYTWTLPSGWSGTSVVDSIVATTSTSSAALIIIATNSCGTSAASNLAVTVNALPAAPTVTSPVVYCENAAAVPLTATGSSLTWYATATGGTALTAAPTPVTSTPGTTDYWVSQTNAAGCEGPRAQITASVTALPPTPAASGTTIVCVGDTIFLSGSSAASSPTYDWTGPNGFSSTIQNPFVAPAVVASAGVYKLSVTVNNCVSPYDSLVVVVSCIDSVWPGDVNYDKLVDNTDVLEIALAMGSTGPSRSHATILWQPEHCADWSTMLPSNSSINGKHADCDGDGIVGYGDTLAVSANYGLTHPRGIRSPRKQTAGLPALYFDMTGISPNAGGTVSVPIMLGNAATPVQGMAGLAARLMIDGVVPVDTPSITYAGSWLGGSGNTLQFAKAVSNNRVDWAYARIDQQNNGGSGVLGWITFTLPPGANGSQLKMSFDGVLIVDSAGAEFTEYNTEEDSVVVLPPLATSTGVRLQAGLHVLPNPSSGSAVVQLTLPVAGAYTLEVLDLSGKLLWQTSANGVAGAQKISLPIEDISSGVYLLKLRSDVGVAQPVRWIKN